MAILERNKPDELLSPQFMRKLDQLAASGAIRKVQIDGCVRFDLSDLDSFIESRKTA